MYKLTCAHREYAFGTKLRVTNSGNQRSVECVVNDRGPFVEGRDLDLSYAAAKEIGVVGPGTARVFVEVRGRDSSYIREVRVRAGAAAGPFAIQVGAFTERDNATRLKTALDFRYGNVYIQTVEVKGKTYYRVRVGNFEAMNAALPIAEQLGQEGYRPLVIKADVKI